LTYRNFGKRAFDLSISLMLLSVGWPLLFLLGALVRIKLGKPILFRQERPGLNEELFTLRKFRTMTDSVEASTGLPLSDAERLTPFGRWLRSSSLDELPELINVVRGDMSLVGPRPLLVRYLDRYTPKERCRHTVRPGMTGLAQVSGRNGLTWQEKFALDAEYVQSLDLHLDLKIIFLTLSKVFRQEGISQVGRATADEFMGSNE
jgi:sugar transferase EpsL